MDGMCARRCKDSLGKAALAVATSGRYVAASVDGVVGRQILACGIRAHANGDPITDPSPVYCIALDHTELYREVTYIRPALLLVAAALIMIANV